MFLHPTIFARLPSAKRTLTQLAIERWISQLLMLVPEQYMPLLFNKARLLTLNVLPRSRAASYMKQRRHSIDSSSIAATSNYEFFHAGCERNSPICVVLGHSVDAKALTCTSRRDCLYIAFKRRMVNYNLITIDEGMDSLDAKHVLVRCP